MQNNRSIGTVYEQMAGKYLADKGYEILEYNYRCRMGEIDIIAKDRDELVFVEVKYRKNLAMGTPLEAVTASKQKVIGKCAKYYLVHHYRYEVSCRFDVVGIVGKDSSDMEVLHLTNAFEMLS